MRDFSLNMLRELLVAFKGEGFAFVRFEDYWKNTEHFDANEKTVLYRHDVDRFPGTALATAKIESEIGIAGTYFFRVKPHTFDKAIIKEIADLGHEIGYHYETLADAGGDFEKARVLFEECLGRLRTISPVVSASMHSRALSKWDNRLFWDEYSLDQFGLGGETYRSIDHHHYMYLADSGRDWNADRNVVWDTVDGIQPPRMQKGTRGLIEEISTNRRIGSAQLLVHPNRWPASYGGYLAQTGMDMMINIAKTIIKSMRRPGTRK